MYSLSISFGPAGTIWALLFKTEEKAGEAYNAYVGNKVGEIKSDVLIGADDFGQTYAIPFAEIHSVLLEDLEQVETARIQRALVDERCKAKFMTAARSDPTIRAAMGNSTPIMTPMGGSFRGN
jgi:hypothetical protein